MKSLIKKYVLFLILTFSNIEAASGVVCTACDEIYFDHLLNLIGSIHENSYDSVEEVLVFDLGMTSSQKDLLEKMQRVKIYQLEKVHPYTLKFFRMSEAGKVIRGWYSWKPVAIKQALDTYDTVLYLDSGNTVNSDLSSLFSFIKENGYFFVGINLTIENSTTERVRNYFNLDFHEKKYPSVSANIIGFSSFFDKTKEIMNLMYRHSKDMYLYEDDGTAPGGFGWGRHDQVLWSVYVNQYGLKIFNPGVIRLKILGKDKDFRTHWNPDKNMALDIYQSRWDFCVDKETGLPLKAFKIRYFS